MNSGLQLDIKWSKLARAMFFNVVLLLLIWKLLVPYKNRGKGIGLPNFLD